MRVGWKVHSLTNILSWNVTKWGLFFNIVLLHTFSIDIVVHGSHSSKNSLHRIYDVIVWIFFTSPLVKLCIVIVFAQISLSLYFPSLSSHSFFFSPSSIFHVSRFTMPFIISLSYYRALSAGFTMHWLYPLHWWRNGYDFRKETRRPKFESLTVLFTFHIVQILLRKVWIQLLSLYE